MVSMILFTEAEMTIIGAENIKDLFGFTGDECMGQHFSRLLAPTYRELCQQLVWESTLNKKSMLVEGQHKNEHSFPITLLVTEQEMGGQSVLFASIFPVHVDHGLITLNKHGNIIALNSRAEKIFERTLSELRDKHIKNCIPALEAEGSIFKGVSKQVIGLSSNGGKQLSLWISVDPDSSGFGELTYLKVEDLSPDVIPEAECVIEVDGLMTVVNCSRFFIYTLLGYLNCELIGQNIHSLIEAKDLKVNIPKPDENDGPKTKRMKMPAPPVNFVATSSRVMVRNKSGFSTPFNMHVSPYNEKTERFSIYLKPVTTSLSKPPDEIIGNRVIADYAFQLQVDNGECSSSTSVFSAVHKPSGEMHAIKIINKRLIDPNLRQRLIAEYQIASSLHHVNIIRYVNQIETDNYLCTIMEFGKDGSVQSYIRKQNKLSEDEARKLFRDMTRGLCFMHENKCVHGDIKLNNAVVIDGVVKLIDFNMSKRMDEQNIEPTAMKRTTFCGTSEYIAPEMVLNKDYDGQKADIWSLGVCLYYMLVGGYPFDSIAASLQQRLHIPNYITPPCVELIKSILMFHPGKRFTTQQILAHPWMQEPDKPQDSAPTEEPPSSAPSDSAKSEVAPTLPSNNSTTSTENVVIGSATSTPAEPTTQTNFAPNSSPANTTTNSNQTSTSTSSSSAPTSSEEVVPITNNSSSDSISNDSVKTIETDKNSTTTPKETKLTAEPSISGNITDSTTPDNGSRSTTSTTNNGHSSWYADQQPQPVS